MFRYLLILCLSVALLLPQSDKLHMHLEQDDHSVVSEHAIHSHAIDTHPDFHMHDFELTNHNEASLNNHSANAIDMSTEKLLIKASLLSAVIFILFYLISLLSIARLWTVTRQTLCNIPFLSRYYLLQPPLRAPPIK